MNQLLKKHYNKGFDYFKNDKPHKAIKEYKKALKLDPEFIEAYVNLGAAYQKAGKKSLAIKSYKKAAKIEPRLSVVYFNIASLYQDDKPSLAIDYYEKVIDLDPKDWDTFNRLGLLYKKTGQILKAIDSYKESVRLNPEFGNAYFNLGVALSLVGTSSKNTALTREALSAFRKARKINPNSAETISNIALVLQHLEKNKSAERYYKLAIKINPELPQVYYNLGSLYEKLGEHIKTSKYYKKALEINPHLPETLGNYCFIQRQLCDWDEYEKYARLLTRETSQALRAGKKPSETAFFNAVRVADPKLNAKVASTWTHYVVERYKELRPPIFRDYKKKRSNKIRIAYATEGFRDFPTTHNVLGVLKRHNRRDFEVYAYSYGPDDKSKYRKKVIQAVDVFRDIKNLNLTDMAHKVYEDNIDIFIDLKGHTRGSRFEFLYSRPAPIQIDWLGFVGTTQADFIDYYIADKIVLPEKNARYFSEKIIYMPDSYWPTNNEILVSKTKYKRSDFNLPHDKIIFASFNHPYKLEPRVLKVWANILKHSKNSVLWQWSNHKKMRNNFLKEATKLGIDKERIIFAEEEQKEKHLARLSLADIALDTFTCNGHTTTTDALWMGVPVVTLLGNHYASRVSASMLEAIGLPELVAKNTNQYQEISVNLANNPTKLIQIKKKLNKNKYTQPLFDTDKFVKNLEKAYKLIWKNYKSNKPTKRITI